MVRRAIASASRHGVKLTMGRPNAALGNCAFEAAIYNINDHSCFNDRLTMSADYYRRVWCTDMENRLFNTLFNPGLTFEEWHEGWEKVKSPNVYEVDLFCDFDFSPIGWLNIHHRVIILSPVWMAKFVV